MKRLYVVALLLAVFCFVGCEVERAQYGDFKLLTDVKDGKISMSNEGYLNNDYVVLLAKFPLNTFNTTNFYDKFVSFDDIYTMAEKGSYKYNNNNFIITFLSLFPFLILGVLVSIFSVQ